MNGSFRLPVLIALCSAASFVLPAEAADRMRPVQWAGTTVAGGKTFPTLSCISQADAEAINGDAKAVQGYLEKIIPQKAARSRTSKWMAARSSIRPLAMASPQRSSPRFTTALASK